MNKIKILIVIGNTGRGGAQAFVMNILRNIDLKRFEVDLAVNEIIENGFTDEIKELGSNIHLLPFFKVYNYFSYCKAWNKLLSNHKYDIVHGNVSSSAVVYLRIAKKHGCKTILHSHNAGYRGKFFGRQIRKVFSKNAKKYGDFWFSCSELASKRLFNNEYKTYKHYYLIPNAINTDLYRFNEITRNSIRERIGVDRDTFVVGHVGSFTYQKNHRFLLAVFNEIKKKKQDSILLLAGEGELKESIKKYAEELNLIGYIHFLGNVGNVNEYMMAMDLMLFPSLFEGFPVVLIESQAAGVPTIMSDSITREALISDCIETYSLDNGADKWAEKAISPMKVDRIAMNDYMSKTIYNMKESIKNIEELYSLLYMNR